MKLLVVFNTCGIARENYQQYIFGINSIVNQEFDSFRVVMSSCLNSKNLREGVRNFFGDKISYNFIDDKLPVNVTFNHSCLKAREEFGDFDGYLYIDSGITLTKSDNLSKLYELFKSGPNAMVAAQTSTDAGYLQWFGIGSHHHDTSQNHLLFQNGDFQIPVGKTVNLHVQIFSKDLLDAYNYLVPDIYAGYCTESVFSFLCAAIKQRFMLSKDVIVDHIHGMDGGSSGFDPIEWVKTGRPTQDHPFLVDSVYRIAKDGHQYGFGYEECANLVNHNPDLYDENGFCKNEHLAKWIRDNQFVGNIGLLDYSTINHTWIR